MWLPECEKLLSSSVKYKWCTDAGLSLIEDADYMMKFAGTLAGQPGCLSVAGCSSDSETDDCPESRFQTLAMLKWEALSAMK